jgi:hypothetical protein
LLSTESTEELSFNTGAGDRNCTISQFLDGYFGSLKIELNCQGAVFCSETNVANAKTIYTYEL